MDLLNQQEMYISWTPRTQIQTECEEEPAGAQEKFFQSKSGWMLELTASGCSVVGDRQYIKKTFGRMDQRGIKKLIAYAARHLQVQGQVLEVII
jgi:hypothetical protein